MNGKNLEPSTSLKKSLEKSLYNSITMIELLQKTWNIVHVSNRLWILFVCLLQIFPKNRKMYIWVNYFFNSKTSNSLLITPTFNAIYLDRTCSLKKAQNCLII